MFSLANDPEMAKQMGERGKNIVFEKYNCSVIEKRPTDLYRTIMKTKR